MTKDQMKERLENLHLNTRYCTALSTFILKLHCNIERNSSIASSSEPVCACTYNDARNRGGW